MHHRLLSVFVMLGCHGGQGLGLTEFAPPPDPSAHEHTRSCRWPGSETSIQHVAHLWNLGNGVDVGILPLGL